MGHTKAHITELHAQHQETEKSLAFYRDEINLLQKRLSEIATKNNHSEILAWVDHFEHQFTINLGIISELTHHIHDHESKFKNILAENPVATEHKLVEDHAEFRGKVKIFEKLYAELKSDFNKFSGKVL
jgi:hypothetical protein